MHEESSGSETDTTENNFASYKALKEAIVQGNANEVRRLIAEGVNVNFDEYYRFDEPALMLAIQCHPNNNEIPLLLIEAGANVRARDSVTYDNYGLTALHYATFHWNIDLMRVLIEQGADVNAQGGERAWTPLTYCNDEDQVPTYPEESRVLEGVNLLLEHGANPDDSAIQALHWVAENNFITVAQRLLIAGADINATDRTYYTPLMRAAWVPETLPMLKFLCAQGADISLRNCLKQNAADIARKHNNEPAVDFLVEAKRQALVCSICYAPEHTYNTNIYPSDVTSTVLHFLPLRDLTRFSMTSRHPHLPCPPQGNHAIEENTHLIATDEFNAALDTLIAITLAALHEEEVEEISDTSSDDEEPPRKVSRHG